MAQKPPRAIARSNSINNDESIYTIADRPNPSAAPKIRVFNIAPAPTAESGKAPKMHEDSSQIGNILNPVQGPRDAQMRAGMKPVNHARQNAQAVKEQSSLNALRKQQDSAGQQGPRHPESARSRSTSAPPRRISNPDSKDFVRENKVSAAAPSRPPKPVSKQDEGQQFLKKKDFGRVPKYLVERKIEMAEEEESKRKAKEDALIPPGMRIMPEEERLETLAILTKNRAEVERAIQQLPIIIETPSQIRRKDELEKRLREIEEAFKIFSRPKVLVHL